MQAASTSNVHSVDLATRCAFNTPDRPHSDNQALTHLKFTTHPTSGSSVVPTSDAQSTPSSFGPDHYASLRSTPVRSAYPSTSHPPPGLSNPINPPLSLHNLKNLSFRFRVPVCTPARPRRPGYQPYNFGHLAFDYIAREMQSKRDSSQGNDG